MTYILGIDIGTSGCKCDLLDGNGDPVASRARSYNPTLSVEGMTEQDPMDWYRAAISCLDEMRETGTIDLNEVAAISVTGQMQGITLLGADGEAVRNSILWSDIRAAAETAELNSRLSDVFTRNINFPATPALSVSKIAWLRNHEPESWQKTDKFLFASNFISFKLTGNITTDENNVALSGLNNTKANNWSDELITACEIEKDKLPELTGCFDVIGMVTNKAARETGLPEGTPVVSGGGDAGAESYSVGIAGQSKVKVRLGSASATNMVIHVDTVKDMDVWPGIRDVMPDHLMMGAYTAACALSVKWTRDVFFSEHETHNDTYSLMDREAESVPLGCGGLIYHPYLNGEAAPYFNPALRAKFNGISEGHRRKHFLRAVYEGVSFSLRDVLNSNHAFRDAEEMIFIGGGTKSKLWISILADVLGKGGVIPECCDAAYGAALMAGQGTGIIDAQAKIKRNMESGRQVGFNAENHTQYNEIFEKYMQLAGV